MIRISDIIHVLERWFPLQLAEPWDNVGLLWGDDRTEAKAVLTCLTLTPDVAQEAIHEGAQLIVVHHPILFRPVQRITAATEEGKMLLSLAQKGIAVYSPHTSFDNAPGGINDLLCDRLGLESRRALRPANLPHYKLVVFVPASHLEAVRQALFAAGAGIIGAYRECSFTVSGTGTFFGTESTQPAVGQKGRREEVAEHRLEVICPESTLERALQELRRAHPYEEPAVDVYPLRGLPGTGGAGRLGRLPRPMSPEQLAAHVCQALSLTGLELIASAATRIEWVAVSCGAGAAHLDDALAQGAQAFLTGEMRFHDQVRARQHGLTVLLAGHYQTERPGVEELARRLAQHFPGLRVWTSQAETTPVCLYPALPSGP